jgi:hypothetical protein
LGLICKPPESRTTEEATPLACTYKHSLEGRRKMASTANRKAGNGVRFVGITSVYHRFSCRFFFGGGGESLNMANYSTAHQGRTHGVRGRATTPPPLHKRNLKITDFVNVTTSNVKYDLSFSRNQPLKSADDSYIKPKTNKTT